jgi:hypothetical protein
LAISPRRGKYGNRKVSLPIESHGGLADVMVSGQQRGFTARGDDDLTWTDGESALEGFAGEWRQECREL